MSRRPDVVAVGWSHRTAAVGVRERLAAAVGRPEEVVRGLLSLGGVEEAASLSTCNRVEAYAVASDPRPLLERLAGGDGGAVGAAYVKVGPDAVQHLFRVASSLDSMVVGEAQILGQVKEAYEAATRAGGCGPVLHALFAAAFRCAKRVRTETGLGAGAVSVPTAAVDLAERIFGDLSGRPVFLLGAGEMSELVLRALVEAGARVALVASRRRERAEDLAAEADAEAIGFEDLPDRLAEAEIVIASTAAPHAVVRRADVEAAIRRRPGRPLFFIDIAVPRDVAPDVHDLPDVYVYDIDALEGVVAANMRERRGETAQAERIVEEEVSKHLARAASLEAAPAIRDLRRKAEEIRAAEVERALGRIADLPPEAREAARAEIERLSAAIVAKLLHAPTVAVKGTEAGEATPERVAALRKLFALE